MSRRGPDIDVGRVLDMRAAGKTYREIGAALGVAPTSVSNRMLAHRRATAPVPAALFVVERPRRMTSRAVARHVADLVAQCGSQHALAEAAGVSETTVSRAVAGTLTTSLLTAIGVAWDPAKAAYVRSGRPKVVLLAQEYRRLRDEVVRAHEENEALRRRIETITARRAA